MFNFLIYYLVDVHDGPEEPLVYNGNTLTGKISLRETLETINLYAFQTNPYICLAIRYCLEHAHLYTVCLIYCLQIPSGPEPEHELQSAAAEPRASAAHEYFGRASLRG